MLVDINNVEGLELISPKLFSDSRGSFFEYYNKKQFKKLGIDCDFVQDNQSYSKKNVLRGLHLQVGDFAQSKLVSVLSGSVLDVMVDVRKGSKTFGDHCKVVLSGENRLQVFMPKGFAHGFVVLSDEAIFHYKCDNFYDQKSERSINYNDVDLSIDWKVLPKDLVLSEKDLNAISFKEFKVSL